MKKGNPFYWANNWGFISSENKYQRIMCAAGIWLKYYQLFIVQCKNRCSYRIETGVLGVLELCMFRILSACKNFHTLHELVRQQWWNLRIRSKYFNVWNIQVLILFNFHSLFKLSQHMSVLYTNSNKSTRCMLKLLILVLQYEHVFFVVGVYNSFWCTWLSFSIKHGDN